MNLTALPLIPEATRGLVSHAPSLLIPKRHPNIPVRFYNDGPTSIEEMRRGFSPVTLESAVRLLERFREQHPALVIDSMR